MTKLYAEKIRRRAAVASLALGMQPYVDPCVVGSPSIDRRLGASGGGGSTPNLSKRPQIFVAHHYSKYNHVGVLLEGIQGEQYWLDFDPNLLQMPNAPRNAPVLSTFPPAHRWDKHLIATLSTEVNLRELAYSLASINTGPYQALVFVPGDNNCRDYVVLCFKWMENYRGLKFKWDDVFMVIDKAVEANVRAFGGTTLKDLNLAVDNGVPPFFVNLAALLPNVSLGVLGELTAKTRLKNRAALPDFAWTAEEVTIYIRDEKSLVTLTYYNNPVCYPIQ